MRALCIFLKIQMTNDNIHEQNVFHQQAYFLPEHGGKAFTDACLAS